MKDIKVGYIPRISAEENKAKAEQILKDAGFWGNKIPMQVELLANKMEFIVETFEGLQTRFDSKGFVFWNNNLKQFQIIIDNDHYNNDAESYLFTISEEISHIILHSDIFKQVESLEDRLKLDADIGESTHRYIEMQAKSLASEILLPTDLFYDYVSEWVKNNVKILKDEKPINQDDFISILSRKLRTELGLSEIIIKRALVRDFGPMFIKDLTNKYKIGFLENAPRNPMRTKREK